MKGSEFEFQKVIVKLKKKIILFFLVAVGKEPMGCIEKLGDL